MTIHVSSLTEFREAPAPKDLGPTPSIMFDWTGAAKFKLAYITVVNVRFNAGAAILRQRMPIRNWQLLYPSIGIKPWLTGW